MTRKIIYSFDAPEPVGPHNQAVLEFSSILEMTVFPIDLLRFLTVNGAFRDKFRVIRDKLIITRFIRIRFPIFFIQNSLQSSTL